MTPTDKETRGRPLLPSDAMEDVYRPVAYRTEGARLACLVNASVTVCGDDAIYAFGGFDQYSDEVFNHVLKLDLNTYTWSLVDNYGDIPSVRMGHTATYWKDDKLIVFGGENEQRMFLSDVYIFDIQTATWSQPVLSGHPPVGRSRHAVALHDDKLFIIGGMRCSPSSAMDTEDEMDNTTQEVLDDVCYLDLRTMTWSKSWSWVARFDHQAWVREDKLWVFGGMGKKMDRTGELVSLDISHFVFARQDTKRDGYATRQPRRPSEGVTSGQGRVLRSHRSYGNSPRYLNTFNHNTPPPKPNPVPASSNSIRFLWGEDIPSESHGNHFHHLVGDRLIDFITIANTIRPSETGIQALCMASMRWHRIANGISNLGGANWRWHYLAASPNSTKVYLLGCERDEESFGDEEQLSDVLPIDLTQWGITVDPPHGNAPKQGMLGADFATIFDSENTGADFTIRAIRDEATEGDEWDTSNTWGHTIFSQSHDPSSSSASSSFTINPANPAASPLPPESLLGPPIKCHTLILLTRWPHFRTLYNAHMAEYHTSTLYLPEPYSVVRAFLYYLYTDSLPAAPSPSSSIPPVSPATATTSTEATTTIASLLPLSHLYSLPRLRTLCVSHLQRNITLSTAVTIWEKAGIAGEDELRERARRKCLLHWGRVVRSGAFGRLSRGSLLELLGEVGVEARVEGGSEGEEEVGGEEGGEGGEGVGDGGDEEMEII
ncbi:galactose oxidase [Ascodesmis nigricans]|uniref:Galactose oxidase n=1 Tax=Ascodesmis nigricans TaxID=341454 RepID=A0A4V3SHX5_9PEZI|nr:galactose oxidase [Ascodesmis nigricans]